LRVAADALGWCGASRADPVPLEWMRERFLAAYSFRGREGSKLQYAMMAAAAISGGAEPDLLDEVAWWQTDLWQYAMYAAAAFIRLAADRMGVPVSRVCRELRSTGPACPPPALSGRGEMARTWLSIRVDLVEGHGVHLWPRPGRIFAAARSHTFSDLAGAIDDAFARWDRSHLQEFTLADGTRLCDPDPDWQVEGQSRRTTGASGCRGCVRVSSSPTCSTSAITGRTCVRSATTRSTQSRPWNPAGQAIALLGLGRHPRPVSPPLGPRRRRSACAI
jgi:hypothetical protein